MIGINAPTSSIIIIPLYQLFFFLNTKEALKKLLISSQQVTNKAPKNNNNNNWSAPLWLDGSARNWIGLTLLLLTDAQPERNSQRLATSEAIRLTQWKTTYTAKLFFFPCGLFPTTTTSSETCWHAWENILLCWDAELVWFFPAILGGHRRKISAKTNLTHWPHNPKKRTKKGFYSNRTDIKKE